MSKINLDKYITEMSTLYQFYRYSEYAFAQPKLRDEIRKEEIINQTDFAQDFIIKENSNIKEINDFLKSEISKKVDKDINNGLEVLRRQLLEASYSIFERYLCHLVKVYLNIFPKIMMDIEKSISFKEIAALHNKDKSIFDHAVEKEISHFSRKSLQEKKDYILKRLKLTYNQDVWLHDNEELWKDIDKKRQDIVHNEDMPNISKEFLLISTNYFFKIMTHIAIYAQKDQGIKFQWGFMSDHIKIKDKPTLK